MKIRNQENGRQVPAKTKKYKKRDYMGLIYIAPWLVGLLVLQIYPFVTSFYYSFTDYQFFNSPEFIGWETISSCLPKIRNFSNHCRLRLYIRFLQCREKLLWRCLLHCFLIKT